MKIAHLIPQFYPYVGGAEICIHNVCRTLVDEGHEAVIITTAYKPDEKLQLPYEVVTLWNRTCGLLKKYPPIGKRYLLSRLAQLQKKHNFDLWQVTAGYPLGVYAIDFFNKNKIPCVLRCCGEDIQKFPQINYGYRLDEKIDKLAKYAYPHYNALVALTPTVKDEYNALGIPDSKIKIIPNGADFVKFAKARKNKEKICEIRNKFNVGDKKLILTTGRYHQKKGFDFIPIIASELKKSGIEFKWVIAGNGVCEIRRKFPECEDLGIICSEEFTKSEGETFSLPPASLIDLYSAADIYLLPTLIETFGMVLVEAMAAGLPIVTTNAPGVNDVIEEGQNGMKAQSGNVADITKILLKVLGDRKLSSELSEQALIMAEERYEWKVVTAKYIDLYTKVIKSAVP